MRSITVLPFKFLKDTPEEYMTNIILYIDTLHYNSIPDYDHIAAHLAAAVKVSCTTTY